MVSMQIHCHNDATDCRADGAATMVPSAAAPAFHLGYRRWLDGLRGLAVLLVLAFHLSLLPSGFLGVDVFLVLSGFLITSLLAQEWRQRGTISLRRFYLRRALRLLPAFLVLLAGCYLVTLLLRPAHELRSLRKEMIVAACYVTNWPTLHQVGLSRLAHTWSLSLEEQFYVFWPPLLYGMLRLRLSRRCILSLVCGGIVASASLRAALWGHDLNPLGLLRLLFGLDCRADALLIGCLVGLLATWNRLPSSRRGVFWSGVAAMAAAAGLLFLLWHEKSMFQHDLYRGVLTLVALLVAVILVRLLAAPCRFASLVLEFAPLVGVGRISYALYLFHWPIIVWLGPAAIGYWEKVTLITALSSVAAVLSFYCVERPCLRWKDRLQQLDPGIPPLVPAACTARAAVSEARPMAA
jgi:peptidoglycan/LPS O-acetylase OafA/YrhL